MKKNKNSAFKDFAEANGMTITEAAKYVLDNKNNYEVAGGSKMATGGEVDGEPNKITSKEPPVKNASDLEKLKQEGDFNLGKKKSYKKPTTNVFSKREYIEPIKPNLSNTETRDALIEINNPKSNAIDTNPVSTKPAETKELSSKSNFWDKVSGSGAYDAIGGALGSAMNYGLSAYQIKEGKKGLASNKRPIDTLDPAYVKQVDQALANQKFGYTPEHKFLIDQQNQAKLNQEMFAAKNYAGGSAANAFNMSRSALNNAFTRDLQTASENQNLMQAKQQYATQLTAQKAAMNRNIFQDSLDVFKEKEAADAELLNAGIGNLFQSNRFANYLALRNQEQNFNRQYNP